MSVNKINVNDQHQVTFPDIGSSNSDFDIRDNNGNILTLFKNGHLKTKEFNSATAVQTSESINATDLEFIDSSSNCVLRVNNGHIKTKNFNSETLENTIDSKIAEAISSIPVTDISRFYGKRMAIVGDSISTYTGTMPSGYSLYYPLGEVNNVNKMWWHIVCTNLGMNYTNCAWSGSTVTGSPKGNARAGCSDQRAIDAGRDGVPDIVIFYISCNDWGYGTVELGNWKTTDPINPDITTDVTTIREAYALMLYKFLTRYPNARLFCCTNLDDVKRDKDTGWPSNNIKGISTYEWNCNIREVAEALGATIIDLHACGINYANVNNFTIDSGLHPNVSGMRIMAKFILANLIANY